MGKVKDITGKVFGRLTVLAPAPRPKSSKSSHQSWLVLCDCGNQKVVNGASLRNGNTKSCGCLQKERAIEGRTKHGMHRTRLYRIYCNMKTRCYNPNNKDYKNYGARGIKVWGAWIDKENGFVNFYNWALKNGYNDSLTLDRINPNGDYEISNLRWVNASIQGFNQRPRSNKTGHTGIYKQPNGKYRVQINKNRKTYYLGAFATLEEAVEARQKAERKFYPECQKE